MPALKGIDADVEMFSVVAPGTPHGPDVERVYPISDRVAELGALDSVWLKVKDGSGAVLAVEGEAGVGKSRLIYEFLQIVGRLTPWLTVQCSPLTSHVPFAPFVSAPPRAAPGRDRSPEERRAELLQGMFSWVFQLAADGPGVLHIEDSHWADPSTGELLERIAEEVCRRPLLVVCTVRPTDGQKWMAHSSVQFLRLRPLEHADIRQLVNSTSKELPDSTVDDIVQRADGLPLFAEQLAAAMAIAPESVLPATLQASLMAQLDRLGPDIRTLLQLAAAVGRMFDDDLLKEMLPSGVDLPQALDRLVNAGILISETEGRHKFRHTLLQEAAHQSTLRNERRRVHGEIASVLQKRYPSVVNRQPALMAYHLTEANDARAVWWFERAGTQAAESAAFHEATGYFEQALALVGFVDAATELRLCIKLGNAMFGAVGYAAADTLPIWTRAEKLARRLGETSELTSALNGEATYWSQAGSCRRSAEVAEEILLVSESHDLRVGRLRGHCTMALNHLFLGNGRVALEHAWMAIELYRPGDFHEVTYGFGTDQGVISYGVGGAAAWFTGSFDEGLDLTVAAVELGGSLGSSISELLARMFKGVVHHLRGEHELALNEAHVLVDLGTRLRLPFPKGFGHLLLGTERSILDRDPAGVAEALTGVDELAVSGGQSGAPLAFVLLSQAYLAVGDPEPAVRTAVDGLELADALDQHFFDVELLRLKARALADIGSVSEQELSGALRTALDWAMDRDQLGLALRVSCDLSELIPELAVGVIGPLLDRVVGGDSTSDCRRARDILSRCAP